MWTGMLVTLVAVMTSACGSYAPSNIGGDGIVIGDVPEGDPTGRSDTGDDVQQEPDPPEPDDRVGFVTLTQSVSRASNGQSFICGYLDAEGGDPVNADSSFFRVFSLADFDVDGPFTAETVRFGIYRASSIPGEQPVTVRIHQVNAGPLSLVNFDQLAETTISVPNQQNGILEVPLTASVPAGSTLAVELAVPDGDNGDFVFIPGMNGAGQTAPSYFFAPRCNYDDITDMSTIPNIDDRHLVIEVEGIAE